MQKRILHPGRVRAITGSFGFIEHRFLRDGFFAKLTHQELALYLFLVLAADRNGLSYYGYDSICEIVGIHLDEYVEARDSLIAHDLLSFDGRLFQLLSLPQKPKESEARPWKRSGRP